MTALLITIHVVSCIVLILVVLLQAGRGADMGAAFGGASTPMFGSGSSTNPLARMTTITAVLFLTTALFLAVGSARRASVFDATPEPLAAPPQAESIPPAGAPAASDAPAGAVPQAQPLTIPATPEGSDAAPAAGDAAPSANAPAAAPSAPAAGDVAPQAAAPAAPQAAPATPPSAPAAAPAAPGAAPAAPADSAPPAAP